MKTRLDLNRRQLSPDRRDRGVMDIQAIVTALKQVGFNGFASIEQDQHPGDSDMRETCREYLRIMREGI